MGDNLRYPSNAMKSETTRKVLFFALLFALYFSVGQSLTKATRVFRTEWLSIDSPKIALILSDPSYSPPRHRQLAHPLFKLFFRPIGAPLAARFRAATVSVAFNAFFAAAGIVAFLAFAQRLRLSGSVAWLYSWLLGISTVHILYGAFPETFIYSFASLMLMPLLYVGIRSDRGFVAALALATFFAVGITVTNIVFSLLWLGARLWSLPRRQQLRFVAAFGALSTALLLGGLVLHGVVYPADEPFLSNDFFSAHAEFLGLELSEHPLSFVGERLVYFFVHSIIAPSIIDNPHSQWAMYGLELAAIPATWPPTFLLYLAFFGLTLHIIYLERLYRDRVFAVLALYFAFNFGLHLIYGTEEPHLYGAHYTFALVGMFAFALRQPSPGRPGLSRKQRVLKGLLLGFCLAVSVNNFAFLYAIYSA
jgi:hypothetical protein